MRIARLLLVGAIVFAILPFGGASAADRQQDLLAGETKSWSTAVSTGVNTSHFGPQDDAVNPERCTKDPQNYCDYTLVSLTNPVPDTDADGKLKKTANMSLTEFGPLPGPISDFDLKIYESDANGTKGPMVNTPWTTAQPPDYEEHYAVSVTTTTTQPTKYYLLEVIYFTTVNGSCKVTVQF